MIPEKKMQKANKEVKKKQGLKFGSLGKKTRREPSSATATGKIRKAQGCGTSTNQKSSVKPSFKPFK